MHNAPTTADTPRPARELTLDAASAARSSKGSSRPLDRTQVKKLLDSRNEREVLDGLRRVTSVCGPPHACLHPALGDGGSRLSSLVR
jgi:hypothetical protein